MRCTDSTVVMSLSQSLIAFLVMSLSQSLIAFLLAERCLLHQQRGLQVPRRRESDVRASIQGGGRDWVSHLSAQGE